MRQNLNEIDWSALPYVETIGAQNPFEHMVYYHVVADASEYFIVAQDEEIGHLGMYSLFADDPVATGYGQPDADQVGIVELVNNPMDAVSVCE